MIKNNNTFDEGREEKTYVHFLSKENIWFIIENGTSLSCDDELILLPQKQ